MSLCCVGCTSVLAKLLGLCWVLHRGGEERATVKQVRTTLSGENDDTNQAISVNSGTSLSESRLKYPLTLILFPSIKKVLYF